MLIAFIHQTHNIFRHILGKAWID